MFLAFEFSDLTDWITAEWILLTLRILVLLCLGLPLVHFLAKIVGKAAGRYTAPSAASILSKTVFVTGVLLILFMALHELGFRLTAPLAYIVSFGGNLGFDFAEWVTAESILRTLRILTLICLGLPLLHFLSRTLRRIAAKHLTLHLASLLSKAVFYLGVFILLLMTLNEIGYPLTALLGSAAILGVAVGFASQTSLSNIISGIFLIWEQPFSVGDAITVGEISGIVHSIDLLSIKLRTFDNRFVRLPNESLIKSNVTTITRFPIRRYDVQLGVAYKEDVKRVVAVLKDIANKNTYCLDEPEPVIIFQTFGDSSLNFLFGVWFAQKDFLLLRNSIMTEIKERFDAEGIEIPFPHRTLYSGSATGAFPIEMLRKNMASPTEHPHPPSHQEGRPLAAEQDGEKEKSVADTRKSGG
ncbi:MAG: mechanosensitive ion channel family protein [Opitutales bacterium]